MLEASGQQYFLWPVFFSNNSWPIGQNAPPPPTEGVSAHHLSYLIGISLSSGPPWRSNRNNTWKMYLMQLITWKLLWKTQNTALGFRCWLYYSQCAGIISRNGFTNWITIDGHSDVVLVYYAWAWRLFLAHRTNKTLLHNSSRLWGC